MLRAFEAQAIQAKGGNAEWHGIAVIAELYGNSCMFYVESVESDRYRASKRFKEP